MRRFSYIILIVFLHQTFCEQFCNKLIEMDKKLLSPQYWLNKIVDKNSLLMTANDVKCFNDNLIKIDQNVMDPLSFSNTIDRDTLTTMIHTVSSIPQAARFYANGRKLTERDFRRYVDNLNLLSIRYNNPVEFGVVVHRSALRAFPTMDRVFNEAMDTDIDRFQESAVFPGEIVAVLLSSRDKQWYLVRNYNQLAWVKTNAVALASREEVRRFSQIKPFVIAIGDKILTNDIPKEAHLHQMQLDMGTRLPLTHARTSFEPYNHTSYDVSIPVRDHLGNLNISHITLSQYDDLSVGYLPFTKANLIKQSFKFLGERYGWGHDFNARDCTGFVGDIYKTFGLLMPRNSGEQGAGSYGINYRFDQSSKNDEKLAVIKQMKVGDLIYIPGHVMMFIGNEQGKPYIIHDVKSISYITADGKYCRCPLNSVSVTPLLPLYLTQNTTIIDKIYNIKRIRALD